MNATPTRPRRPWRLLLAGLLLGLGALVGADQWRMAGLRDLAAAWQAAHRDKDLAALEALYCWDGVDGAMRARLRLALQQEMDLPVRAVSAERCASLDRLMDGAQRPNLDPTGVIVVAFEVSDGLGARLLAGGPWWRPRLVVLLPREPVQPDSGS